LTSYINKKIGVIGGGQLAQMMALSAHKNALNLTILSSSKDDPAAKVTSNWKKGSPSSTTSISKLAEQVDVITYESEFVPPKCLKLLSDLAKRKICRVHPNPDIMEAIADRLPQKEMLEKFGVPTSPFDNISNSKELLDLKDKRKLPLVLKARRNGYDGYGTYIIKKWSDKKAHDFVDTCPFGVIAEDFISFKRELAVSMAINEKKEVSFLPLVETHQENYKCLWVKGPIEGHKAFSSLKSRLSQMVKKIGYVGLVSFEIFDTGKELIINEIAPRVHNSAHYSQDGLTISQFELHLRAITGAPLETPKPLAGGFAMMNLLGSSNKAPKLAFAKDVKLHWYLKNENRNGRKMGHINAIANSPAMALKKVKKAREEFNL
jgi:5-(carboxyamino)imidazole ribonucleotide synthase